MNLTIVRQSLEDRELANFLPLCAHGVRVEILTSRERGLYDATGLGLPVRRAARVADFLGPAPLARRLRRIVANVKDPDDFLGLPAALATTAVACVNETHIASSAQVCRLKRTRPELRVVVVCYENIPFRYEEDPVLATRKDTVRHDADRFVALTPEAADALRVEGVAASKIVLQPYGVDAGRFSPGLRSDALRGEWAARDEEPVVLFAGRLIQEKGLADLLLAAARIRAAAAFRLVLVGSGDQQHRLERMTRALGLEERVTFVPWLEARQMPEAVASADVFAMPSLPTPYWEEQLGFSLIEAMASAVPVLATRSGSIPFVVDAGGVLVAPYDVAALADALYELRE